MTLYQASDAQLFCQTVKDKVQRNINQYIIAPRFKSNPNGVIKYLEKASTDVSGSI